MKEFEGKVAVVTGAASGIGRGLAWHGAREGMKVVLADIAEDTLRDVEREMRADGHQVLAVKCDVSSYSEVEQLAAETIQAFGEVHLLFNNAGLSTVGDIVQPLWIAGDHDWKLITQVNLQGVINGIRIFLPVMLSQDTECHVVNTASAAGLLSYRALGIYAMTKHAIVALSETAHIQLSGMHSKVGVSVLVPGLVKTDAVGSAVRRHRELEQLGRVPSLTEDQERGVGHLSQAVQSGISPADVAEMTFAAIREGRFYIITHDYILENVQRRLDIILAGGNPIDLS
jgi:NADP-dependent 3-hydroxy acid dehydrogenase YdfG